MAVKEKKAKKTEDIVPQEKVSKKFEKTYMLFAIIAVIVVFVLVIMAYFSKTYVMFSPEKVAVQYSQNTAKLDGYDALKYTVMIKDQKLGDFMTKNYMSQYVKEYAKGEAPEVTAEEEGAKLSQILGEMYPVFFDLMKNYGYQKYDYVFAFYFNEYCYQHIKVYGNDYITTDDMFAAFEGNVASYANDYAIHCETVYGKGADFADKYLGLGKSELADDDIYSPGYTISIDAKVIKEYSEDEVKGYVNSFSDEQKASYSKFGIDLNGINGVAEIETTKTLSGEGDSAAIAEKNEEWKEHPETLTLVKIGSMWYVDITA